jgi:hypothetical protein
MKHILFIAVLMFVLCSCTQESQTPPEVTINEEVTSRDAITIDYADILADNPTELFTPMSKYPGILIRKKEVHHIDVSKLPKEGDIDYQTLGKYAEPPTGTTCTGSKVCEFVCGNTRYIIKGIPDQCTCHNYDGGLDIYCRGICPSFELSCIR